MPLSERICPVCMELGTIGYGKKTCSSECGRAWVKMSKAEQKTRLLQASKTPEDRANELLNQVTQAPTRPVDETGDYAVGEFDRRKVDPSLIMPSGLSDALGFNDSEVNKLSSSDKQIEPTINPKVDTHEED